MKKGLNETAEMVKTKDIEVLTSKVDVSKREDFQRFADETLKNSDARLILINNAGVGLVGRVEEAFHRRHRMDDGDKFLGNDLWNKDFSADLCKRKNSRHIVNISSVFGFIAPPGQSAYCASKFAVRGFTECFAPRTRRLKCFDFLSFIPAESNKHCKTSQTR